MGIRMLLIEVEHKISARCYEHRALSEAKNFCDPPFGDSGFVHIVRCFLLDATKKCRKNSPGRRIVIFAWGYHFVIKGRWRFSTLIRLWAEERRVHYEKKLYS